MQQSYWSKKTRGAEIAIKKEITYKRLTITLPSKIVEFFAESMQIYRDILIKIIRGGTERGKIGRTCHISNYLQTELKTTAPGDDTIYSQMIKKLTPETLK